MRIKITNADRQVIFCPETWQSSSYYQYLSENYSIWTCMDKLYQAKKKYYLTGESLLTDQEYDSLERSIIALRDKFFFEEFNCVGYEINAHKVVTICLDYFNGELNEKFINPWNEHVIGKGPEVAMAMPKKKIELDIKEVIKIEEIIIPKTSVSEVGQVCMVFQASPQRRLVDKISF